MSVPVWCADLAAYFWAKVSHSLPFPRDLRPVIATAIPLSVVDLPGVSVAGVRRWFDRLNIPVPLDEPDRPLRACLVAWKGVGFAFLDALDDPAEQRFSLTHELAHFLRDYLHPREMVQKRLGEAALAVLDGLRPPTLDERLRAILRHVPVGPYAHLLRRDESGQPHSPAEREAEAAADRLAFELLAPAAAVGEAVNRNEIKHRLVETFGLPADPAARYAELLVPQMPEVRSPTARYLRS